MRYARLLPSDGVYTKENMKVTSSDTERCVMSSQSLLAGLMPPEDCEDCFSTPWQPVPVRTAPFDEDNVRIKQQYIGLNENEPIPLYADYLPIWRAMSKV